MVQKGIGSRGPPPVPLAAFCASADRLLGKSGTPGSRTFRDPFPGEILDGSFRLTGLFAKGNLAQLFGCEPLAPEPGNAAYLAKFLLPSVAEETPVHLLFFRREIMMTAGFDHRRLPRFRHSGHGEAGDYLIVHLIRGSTLRSYMETGRRLSPDDIRQCMAGLLEALAAIHQAGIWHLDLKPDNVVLADHQPADPRLVDFGLARHADRALNKGIPDQPAGAPIYVPPEQFVGGALDQRADLYSLGVLLYELVSGHVPFKAPEVRAIYEAKQKLPPPLKPHVPGLSRRQDAFLQKAMAPNPEHRFQSVAEFHDAFDAAWGDRSAFFVSLGQTIRAGGQRIRDGLGWLAGAVDF